ncbi:hypothetical protein [Amycolatopsis sp. lyj-109]|uniref:hypothetical protein n=1 Tax=Amycolatopsis sp. lyj-109 TaxID=2789287 RepID=UPI003977E9AD
MRESVLTVAGDQAARVTEAARTRSGAPDDEVQRFIAYGQLCHLVATLDPDTGDWAAALSPTLSPFAPQRGTFT